MEKKYAAPAVEKLFDIVELLSREDRGYSINEISRFLNIPVNTVYRICKEMEERCYLEKDHGSGLYFLGSKFFIMGQIVGSRFDLRVKALPVMEELRDKLDETIHLCILNESRMVLIDQKETLQPIRIHVETGSILYPHASAFGKCLLAYSPHEILEKLSQDDLKPLTPHTITTLPAFLAELKKVRSEGIAYDMEEYITGVQCVGAPVLGSNGTAVAALGVMAPSYRFSSSKLLEAASIVKEAAQGLSMKMGYYESSQTLHLLY